MSDDDGSDEDERIVAEVLIALRFVPDTGEIWNGWALGVGAANVDQDEVETIVVKTGLRISFRADDLSK